MATQSPINILHSEADYEAAMAEFERYFDDEPAPGTPEADRFELLGMVLARYETEHSPVPASTPLEVLKFCMEQTGRTQADLGHLLGSRSRASEILNGKRELTLDQIRLLCHAWRIPAAALVGELSAA